MRHDQGDGGGHRRVEGRGTIVWAGLALTYELVLRASELFAEEGAQSDGVYCLRVGDVAFLGKGVQLGPRRSRVADMAKTRFQGG